MRVLHVFKTYLPDSFGGIERVIWAISEGTAPMGVENHVLSLTTKRGAALSSNRLDAHFVHKAKLDLYVASTGLSLSAFGKFRDLAASTDIIHYHFPWPMMDLLHLAGHQGKPSVLTYHSDIVRQTVAKRFYSPLMHALLGSVDRIVATSPNYAATSRVLGQYASKTTVIPIGLPNRTVPSEFLVEAWRHRVGSNFFLFVGELRYYKGLGYLLEAAQASKLPVVIAGKGTLASDIPANVTMLGPIEDPDKEALLSLCRAFVFPSHLRSEAFGVALLEAARAGRPMISCEIGTGTSFVNLHGDTGLVVPPANYRALAEAMQVLSFDNELASKMGRAARGRYERVFTLEQMARAYRQTYADLLHEGTPSSF